MRLIERQMNIAIHSGNDWSRNNTSVVHYGCSCVCIYLNGHNIANYNRKNDTLQINLDTLAQWPTVTTKSRLRALGVNVYTRKGITYVNDKEVA